MAPTNKLAMSLDDIIKSQKNGNANKAKKRPALGKKTAPAAVKSAVRARRPNASPRAQNIAAVGGKWSHDLYQGPQRALARSPIASSPRVARDVNAARWPTAFVEDHRPPLSSPSLRRLAVSRSHVVSHDLPSIISPPSQILNREIPSGGFTTGTKVTVANLPAGVIVDDLQEVFGADEVKLKSVKIVSDGVAEVVFARREDAVAAVAKYDNVPLDGRAMILKIDPSAIAASPVARPKNSANSGQATKRLLRGALPA